MKVYQGLEQFKPVKNAVVTQGTFDGVHSGHRQILKKLKELARQIDGETVLLTFFPHPRTVLYPGEEEVKQLTTLDEKIALLSEMKIGHLVVLPFTHEFSQMTSLQFIKDVLVDSIGTKQLVIGYDHRFGKNREGTFEHLKEFAGLYGFEVQEIPEKDIDDVAISSTRIRNALNEGDVATANKYLESYYSLSGKVERGKQLGRQLGFPTANIKVADESKLVPADGVYAVNVTVDEMPYKGMMNIGFRPTVDGLNHALEVHIFDFENDIYDKTVKISFIHRIRDEMKFGGIEDLKNQLQIDKFEALKLNPAPSTLI
jgi:riboflavin kinase/FMN adenylyltransferase